MKKQNVARILNAVSKRKHLISLAVLVVFFCVCCVPPAGVSEPTGVPSETVVSSSPTPVTPTTEVAVTNTPAPTETSTPVPTQTQISLPACIPAGAVVEAATVVEIVDGDTIQVEINGVTQPVRYIGIDTAERGSDFYEEASTRNRELVLGKAVLLVKDVSETDSFDRLLRYVIVDGQFVNEVLVEEGYAVAKEYPPDTACSQAFAEAQTQASSRSAGIWLIPPTEVVVATATVVATETVVPIGTVVATATVAASTSACPTGCVEELPGCSIKGNINSEGVKIYHVPSGKFYSRTQINPSKGERWFCTSMEAEANGWRASME